MRERLGTWPPPVTEGNVPKTENAAAPMFYERARVLWLEKRLRQVAVASIALAFASGLLYLPQNQKIVWAFFAMNGATRTASWVIAFVLDVVVSGVWAAMMYFFIEAVGSILRILMEMERNSQQA